MDQLEDVLRPGEILQAMLAEVAQVGAVVERVAGELGRRQGEQHLAAVARAQEPGDAAERLA